MNLCSWVLAVQGDALIIRLLFEFWAGFLTQTVTQDDLSSPSQANVLFHHCGLWGILNFPFLLADLSFPQGSLKNSVLTFPAQRNFLLSLRKWLAVLKQAWLWLGCLKTVSEIVGSFQLSFEPLNHIFSRDQFARLAGIPADFGGSLRALALCRSLSQTAVLWVCSPGSWCALQPCRDTSWRQGHTWRPRVSLDEPNKVGHSTETSVITPS